MQQVKLQKCCEKFTQHALKYMIECNNQIQLEKIAYENGIISKRNYLMLKEKRLDTAISLNSMAYKFEIACKKIKNKDNKKLVSLIKTMTKIYG